MWKTNSHNQGQSLIGIIIVLVVVGLISGGLYYYLQKQIPEVPEIAEKPAPTEEEEVKPEEKVVTPPTKELPEEEAAPPKEKVEKKPAEKPVIQKCVDGTPDMECSVTKPLYCQSLKLVNACMTCGCPEGMMCQQDNTCTKVDLGKKVYILENGDPSEKLDLLFIPYKITDFSRFRSKIGDILYKDGKEWWEVGLFQVEPFKTQKNKFNVAYIDKNIDKALFGCWVEGNSTKVPGIRIFGCDNERVKKAYKIFDPDFITVIFNVPEGYNSTGGEIQYLNLNSLTIELTFVHELGHQLGLVDEYVYDPARYHCVTATNYECFENYEKALKVYPNIDVLGCPKWCRSYDINKLKAENKPCAIARSKQECDELTERYRGMPACAWFELKHPYLETHCVIRKGNKNIGINCEENTGCFFGADYTPFGFRAGESIMGTGGERQFTKPAQDHLNSILNCCYPRQETSFCQNFRNQFKNIPSSASVHPAFKMAYDKIVNCP